MGLSLKPSEMSSGGGLWGDIRATITEAQFEMSTYDGKVKVPIPVFKLGVKDTDGVDHDQMLSVGSRSAVPGADGRTLEGDGSLNVGSNFGLFMSSLIVAGFPEDRLEDDISVLIGLDAHFDRVAAPERKGLQKRERADGKVYEETVLNVTKIFKLPWEKGTGKSSKPAVAAAKGKVAAPAKGGGDTGAGEVVKSVLLDNLADFPEGMDKKQLVSAVIAAVASHPDKSKIVAQVLKDDFLSGIEGVEWDGTTAQVIL